MPSFFDLTWKLTKVSSKSKIKVYGLVLLYWRYGAGSGVKSMFFLKKEGGTKEPS